MWGTLFSSCFYSFFNFIFIFYFPPRMWYRLAPFWPIFVTLVSSVVPSASCGAVKSLSLTSSSWLLQNTVTSQRMLLQPLWNTHSLSPPLALFPVPCGCPDVVSGLVWPRGNITEWEQAWSHFHEWWGHHRVTSDHDTGGELFTLITFEHIK